MLRKSLLLVLVKSHNLVFSAEFILAKVGKPKTAGAREGTNFFVFLNKESKANWTIFGFFENRQTKPSKRNKAN